MGKGPHVPDRQHVGREPLGGTPDGSNAWQAEYKIDYIRVYQTDAMLASQTKTGTAGSDTLSGGDGNDTVRGGGGNDTIMGARGNDLLEGNDGADSLLGSLGDDTLDGGAGSDILEGGRGNDIYVVTDVGEIIREAADAGTDTVRTSLSSFTLGGNVEHLTYTGGGSFHGGGNALNNAIAGGSGNDTLVGGSGNDTVTGGGGNDRLDGGIGNDVIATGLGNDTVSGASGADLFTFANADRTGTTFVLDFEVGADRLDIGGLGLGSLADVLRAADTNGQGNLVINAGGESIILQGVREAQLTAGNFGFGGSSPPPNKAPVAASLANQTSAEDQPVAFTVPAFSDVDNASLAYTATLANGDALPSWLSFNAASRTFSGTPPQDFTGELSLKVTGSDGQLSASSTFALAITPVNDAPVAASLANQTSAEDQPVAFTVPAFSDVDNASLAYTATLANGDALPSWLSFNAASRTFSGTPPQDFTGELSLKVTGSDGQLSASSTFALAITPVNDAPVAASLANQTSAEDQPVAFTVPAFSDVDNASLAYTATLANGDALPSWLSFNAASRTFSGTPPQDFTGELSLKVTGSDGQLSASSTFALAIISGG
jgi:lysozyme family protein